MSTDLVKCEKCDESMTSHEFNSHMCGEELEILKELQSMLYSSFKGSKRAMKRSFKRKGISKYNKLIDKL